MFDSTIPVRDIPKVCSLTIARGRIVNGNLQKDVGDRKVSNYLSQRLVYEVILVYILRILKCHTYCSATTNCPCSILSRLYQPKIAVLVLEYVGFIYFSLCGTLKTLLSAPTGHAKSKAKCQKTECLKVETCVKCTIFAIFKILFYVFQLHILSCARLSFLLGKS